MSRSQKRKRSPENPSQSRERATWGPYYERVTRNRKKYTRKQKHKPDYRNEVD